MTPRIGSLCSGYGGLDHGVQAVMGGQTVWVSDIDKGACKILAHRYPGIPNLGDFTVADWSTVEPIDVLTAGFPCQPVSHAGKRLGDNDERWLWDDVARAVRELRPSLVVLENVRGLLTAGGGRLFGRVLGALAELGYDTQWHGIRAADVGAPHGRFRVFVTATNTRQSGRGRWTPEFTGTPGDTARRGTRIGALLPTPTSSDTNGAGAHGDGGVDLRTAISMLPTPQARDWKGAGPADMNRHDPNLSAGALLPTPAVNDMGAGKTVEAWDEWTATMQAKHGNGNGHGKSLSIEAQRLLPTPRSQNGETRNQNIWERPADQPQNLENALAHVPGVAAQLKGKANGLPAEAGPREGLRDVRCAACQEAVRQRTPRGPERVPAPEVLLPELRQHESSGDPLGTCVACSALQEADVRVVPGDGAAARPSQGPELGERRPGEPADAVPLMPPETALEGGPVAASGCDAASTGSSMCDLRSDVSSAMGEGADVLLAVQAATVEPEQGGVLSEQSWGIYEDAIRRWEMVLGCVAPPPTILSARGTPQLSPSFSEFLMGLPAGWVTDVPGITRNEALKALGNGVVPQQAEAALRFLLSAAQPGRVMAS